MENVEIKKRTPIEKNESSFSEDVSTLILLKGISILEVGVSDFSIVKREVQYVIKERVSLSEGAESVDFMVHHKTPWENYYGINQPLNIANLVAKYKQKHTLLDLVDEEYLELAYGAIEEFPEIKKSFFDNIIESIKQGT
jgi:hypothetical protein